MRSLFTASLMTIMACKPEADIRSGELAMCITNDGGTAVHQSATASWDVTGTVTNVSDSDGADNPMLDCADDAGYFIDVQKTDGTIWTVAYGILDQNGDQTAPAPDLTVGETINLMFRQIEHSPPARGMVIIDGQGLVLAMDNGIGEGALDSEDIDGLSVRRGPEVGLNKDDCGKLAGSQIEFRTGATVSLQPFNISTVQMEDRAFDVYAISSFYWAKATCEESVDEMAWAVFR